MPATSGHFTKPVLPPLQMQLHGQGQRLLNSTRSFGRLASAPALACDSTLRSLSFASTLVSKHTIRDVKQETVLSSRGFASGNRTGQRTIRDDASQLYIMWGLGTRSSLKFEV